ncbi:MAG: glycosyltransferase family 2 protein [Gemmataceae bacterium]|nr:glycosyltransferase family 2 protein [Planctomycetia bacterium]MBX3397751.1 glycosyltransferase family 2 protein [Gemmataceae bacterium]
MALAQSPGIREAIVRSPATTSVAVVIVNFCQWRNTERLVRQLRRSILMRDREAAIAIVDNASPYDPAVERLKRFADTRIVANARNVGFAAAVNRGAELFASDWILLLNPDVSVPDGFLDDARAAIDRADRDDPSIGAIGFRLVDASGAPQASAGPFPTFASTVLGLLRPRASRKCRHYATNGPRKVDWATGGCLFVRRDCFRDAGGLDERYFLYYEDVDFCRNARAAGYTVRYDPSVTATHHSPLHGRHVPAAMRLVTRQALLAYADRHWSAWERRWLKRIVRLEAFTRRGQARIYGRHEDAELYRRLGELANQPTLDRVREAAELLRSVSASHDLPS